MKSGARLNRPRRTIPYRTIENGSKRHYHRPHARTGLRLSRADDLTPRMSWGDGPDHGRTRAAERNHGL